jgi:DNA-binding transcriptional LysR family regulator
MLEEQVGRPLLRKDGRRLGPTEAGDLPLGYAQRILQLDDEALAATGGLAVTSSVRLGLPRDMAQTVQPATLSRLTRTHPEAHGEILVDRSRELNAAVDTGRPDLARAMPAPRAA